MLGLLQIRLRHSILRFFEYSKLLRADCGRNSSPHGITFRPCRDITANLFDDP